MTISHDSSRSRPRPRRFNHTWPVCPQTGKHRLGEHKDVKLALEAARHSRSAAETVDAQSTWTVLRGYRCDQCSGWHLTSEQSWTPPGRRTS